MKSVLPMTALDQLRASLLKGDFVTDTTSLGPYECDALFNVTQRPGAVAVPRDVAAVRSVLGICAAHGVPIVPRGAGTGLSGGALPIADGVLVTLHKLRDLAIEPTIQQAVAGPGVVNLLLSEAAASHGLFYAPDPSSQIASTIGGNVAENAGGVHCVKYGVTVQNVVGLELATAAGEQIVLGEGALDQPGYDLLALLCGSEGLLGLITGVRVRLLPRPPVAHVLLAFMPDLATLGGAVADIVAAGVVPSGLEVMDQASLIASDGLLPHLRLRTDAAGAILCELDGDGDEVEAATMAVRTVLARHHAIEIRSAHDAVERQALWHARKSILPALLREARDIYIADCTVPRRALARSMAAIYALGREYGIAIVQSFHAGDGNLHPVLVYDASVEGEEARAHALAEAILRSVVAEGGVIAGEHGVGVEKLDAMCWQFGETELDLLHGIKAAFDPEGRLNPGKLLPSLHRCAELGGMHVHNGAIAFPNIPRF